MMKTILAEASQMDMEQSPPAFAQQIHRRLRTATGTTDPYLEIKRQFNRIANELLPDIRKIIDAADDRFEASLKAAIAGNVIDFGIGGDITEEDVHDAVAKIVDAPFVGNIEELKQEVEKAQNILYLADNAGEIVFDRLLIEQLPKHRVTLAVRGCPILNDATIDDAEFAGLDQLVKIIGNGSDAPGTILPDCSDEFLEIFRNADLIIAKGQGNFETLSHCPENIFFMLKVKCQVIASHTGFPLGTHLLLKNPNINKTKEK
jgi:uncharacterized protein with ATP-grasp and redox domains